MTLKPSNDDNLGTRESDGKLDKRTISKRHQIKIESPSPEQTILARWQAHREKYYPQPGVFDPDADAEYKKACQAIGHFQKHNKWPEWAESGPNAETQ